jgi:hypothetical protein
MINDLRHGIFLEDIGTLLPWDTPKEDLCNIANPIQQESGDRFVLYWNGHILCGGIKTRVEAIFCKGNKNAHDDPNAHGKLHLVELNFSDIDDLDPRGQYERLKASFLQVIGAPSFELGVQNGSWERPLAEWDLPDALVVLMVFERLGEYCVGEVWHKPLPDYRKRKS